ncbi:YraN family protein [Curtobacterium sp. MCBD17_034]|nr:YraN family protein [Curtobacterium sp. MCBD17_028]PZE73722.1 YraN family protein [Curtobacterium sp. MCBD17_019]PZF57541.1 YraN family protein [Curtobacterium sp. MCBD17_034]PZM33633.1 YraN family protein [Curtobacterium sp. MCBD17_031]
MQVTQDDGGHNRRTGAAGEDIAARWFEERGARVLDRNWRGPSGELDLVVRHGQTVAVVEVKTRTVTTAGHPFEAITRRKRTRLRRLAAEWCATHPRVARASAVRVDAVAVLMVGDHVAVEHLEDIA